AGESRPRDRRGPVETPRSGVQARRRGVSVRVEGDARKGSCGRRAGGDRRRLGGGRSAMAPYTREVSAVLGASRRLWALAAYHPSPHLNGPIRKYIGPAMDAAATGPPNVATRIDATPISAMP